MPIFWFASYYVDVDGFPSIEYSGANANAKSHVWKTKCRLELFAQVGYVGPKDHGGSCWTMVEHGGTSWNMAEP